MMSRPPPPTLTYDKNGSKSDKIAILFYWDVSNDVRKPIKGLMNFT